MPENDEYNLDFLKDKTEQVSNKFNDIVTQKELFKLSIDNFINFVKIIEAFDLATHLVIENSKAKQYVSNSIVFLDIEDVFSNLSFSIVDLPKTLELFKILTKNKTKDDIVEFYIDSNDNYIIKKNNKSLIVPNQEIKVKNDDDDDFDNIEILGSPIDIDKKEASEILDFFKKTKLRDKNAHYYQLLIDEDQLKGVHIYKTANIMFNDYNYEDIKSDKQYLSLDFLSIPNIKCDSYRVTLFKNNSDNELYIKTLIKSDIFTLTIYEKLNEKVDIPL